jgi:hypothetical protein
MNEPETQNEMMRSELIYVHCMRGIVPYMHYGISIGDGTVVHLATELESCEMLVQRISLEQFARGCFVCIEPVDDALPDDIVVERALEAVGKRGYHLIAGNCEHFAREIKTGVAVSRQVDMASQSVVRTAFSGLISVVSRRAVACSLAAAPGARLLMTAGSLVPTVLSESARCASYLAARKLSYTHSQAETASKRIGYAASAAGGMIVGGPIGSATALSITITADLITDSLHRRLNDQNLNSSAVSS